MRGRGRCAPLHSGAHGAIRAGHMNIASAKGGGGVVAPTGHMVVPPAGYRVSLDIGWTLGEVSCGWNNSESSPPRTHPCTTPGRYEIQVQIGECGMGEVYQVRDTTLVITTVPTASTTGSRLPARS